MSDNKNPGVLRNLRVKRVSLVDQGANFDEGTGDGAHIMLYKAAGTRKDAPSVGAVHVDSTDWREDYEKATIDAETRNSLPDSAFAAVWTDAKGVKQRKLPIHDAGHLAAARGRIDQADLPADVKATARHKIEAATKTKEKAVKKSLLAKMFGLFGEPDAAKRDAAAAEILKAFPDDDADDTKKAAHDPDNPECKCADCMSKSVAKAADLAKKAEEDKMTEVEKAVAKGVAAVEKRNVELEKANATLMASIEVEKAARLDREMYDVLKGFTATPFCTNMTDPKNDVVKFRKMKETDPESFTRVMEIFKAAEAQIALGKSFENIGSGRSGGRGDAWGQIVAKAKSKMEKSAKGTTIEQATDEVLMDPENAKLVAQYRAEQM